MYYNEGLEKAGVRDLTGALNSLRQSLKFNKNNIEARNLLGLVYFELGEVVAALSEWVISKNLRGEKNMMEDTIAAVATAPGESGIGIIRISGDRAYEILEKIFAPAGEEFYRLHRYFLPRVWRQLAAA